MGNLFLGFPVARAKIADMISSSAPAVIHHTQHEDGGSDEINVTGLTGAGGGLQVPFTNHLYANPCSSKDNLNPTVTGSAVIALQPNGIILETFSTANSTALAQHDTENTLPHLAWTKARQFQCDAKLRSATSVTATMVLFTGDYTANRGFGFMVTGGKLYGYCGTGATNSSVELETLAAGSFTKYRNLRAIFTPAVDCKFYVDGVLLGTITTDLPSGTTNSNVIAQFYITNPGVSEDKYMVISNYMTLINS